MADLIETKKVTVNQKMLVGYKCDCCMESVTRKEKPFEFQEFTKISISGGYGSIFGDGDTYECDLCQRCLKKLLGKYLKLKDSNEKL